MKILIFIISFLGIFSNKNSQTDALKSSRLDKTKSFINYHMSHPMHNWDGTSKDIDGIVQYDETTKKINKVVISVKINTFDSKNSNRDAHMLEITEGIKYPTVTFVSSSIKEDGNTVDISGTINFHGVSKQIHFMGNESVINNKKIINGEFVVLLEDFKIERPSMMLMKTDNEMKMNFSVEYLMN